MGDLAALGRQHGGERFWLRPLSLLSGPTAEAAVAAKDALPLAGGSLGLAFAQVEIVARDTASETGMIGAAVPLDRAERWAAASGAAARYESQLDALTAPRGPWAGLDFSRPRITGSSM